ncbi:MAG: hypothetical protein HFI70_05905 [Lachnospiraceae bacterium]|nr:hypothetical protein [Lachnospiraceae bacterium]
MRRNILAMFGIVLTVGMLLAGCGNSSGSGGLAGTEDSLADEKQESALQTESDAANEPDADAPQASTELAVRFGDEGEAFTLHLYDNDTAAAIAKYVGSSDWRLPIYHYDDYDNWEVMQYYDIPNRYEIPSAPENVTEESAGMVYYSEPNRIILFYQDAEVSAEYTPVGYFDYSEEFLEAVQNNPVLEGWGNKIVNISDGE